MQDPQVANRSPTPTSYALAIADLTTSQIDSELLRLATSEKKLLETNETLSSAEWSAEEFAQEAIRENEAVLVSYTWRRHIINEELGKRGLTNSAMPSQQNEDDKHGIEL